MVKILARRDDPDYIIALVRWQDVSHGWWGYTATILANHRAPCLFPRSTWQEVGPSDLRAAN
jgi:hypothetical protein